MWLKEWAWLEILEIQTAKCHINSLAAKRLRVLLVVMCSRSRISRELFTVDSTSSGHSRGKFDVVTAQLSGRENRNHVCESYLRLFCCFFYSILRVKIAWTNCFSVIDNAFVFKVSSSRLSHKTKQPLIVSRLRLKVIISLSKLISTFSKRAWKSQQLHALIRTNAVCWASKLGAGNSRLFMINCLMSFPIVGAWVSRQIATANKMRDTKRHVNWTSEREDPLDYCVNRIRANGWITQILYQRPHSYVKVFP